MPQPPENLQDFNALVEVIKHLRGPEGCPWDKEQTHQTLTQYAIEEAFELAQAIDSNDQSAIVEELGDVLLQVVLHAEIARQEKRFDIQDVIRTINEKMIRRHPHVFSDTKVRDTDEIWSNWHKIKAAEKTKKKSNSIFDFPVHLPALIRSQKIGIKTKKYNFDWSSPEEVLAKVEEELTELKQALKEGTPTQQQQELGDLLFSVAQLARHLSFDAEQALRQTNQRFISRFETMQQLATEQGLDFEQLSAQLLDNLWEQAKEKLST